MQYTTHYNLNLPEGTDIVNPLIQDNPNYSAIDTALYDNKLRVIGNATHTKTGTNHAITLADSDIVVFKFVATGDYATGDTFTVDGVTVTPRIADGSTISNGAFKINSTVFAILDGTILNFIGLDGVVMAEDCIMNNNTNVQDNIDDIYAIINNMFKSGHHSHTITVTEAGNSVIYITPAQIEPNARKIIPTGLLSNGVIMDYIYDSENNYFIVNNMVANATLNMYYIAIM